MNFLKLFVVFLFCCIQAETVYAKTPAEVMKPYKEYRAALEAGDNDKAYKASKKAWKTAEKLVGDSKITGDLAANFASLSPDSGKNSFNEYENRMKAYKRSIELAKFWGEQSAEIELDRHVKRIELGLSLVRIRNGSEKKGGKAVYFDKMEKALDNYNLRGSTFEGDMETLRVRYYDLAGRAVEGVEAAQKAERIYANKKDSFSTHYPVMLKLFKGNVLSETGKSIEAVLEYQDVMQNLEGKLPADHIFVSTAFTEWVKTRAEIVDDGRFKEAEAAGLCRCWPFEEYEDDVLPLERIPPIMPRNARRSGHANLVFDVDEKGKPFNIRVLSSTNDIFEKPSIKSVEKWKYSPVGHGDGEAKIRKDVSTKISFRLTNRNNEIIPEE